MAQREKKYSHVAKKLREYLEENGIKQTFMAKKLGISETAVRRVLAGISLFSKDRWFQVIEFTKGYLKMEDFIKDIEDLGKKKK